MIQYKVNLGLNSVKLKKCWFDNHQYQEQYADLLITTNFLDKTVSMGERIYCIINGITEQLFCPICGNKLKFKSFVEGYRVHCGSPKCLHEYKGTIVDESGLTSNQRSGIGTSKTMKQIESNGKSKSSNCHISYIKNLKETGNYYKIYEQANKCVTTKSNTIISGCTIHQLASIKARDTMNTKLIGGKTIKELRIQHGWETKSILDENGLSGFDKAFMNGAGRNSSIKYYNNDLCYQGTYEKDFLDLMTDNYLIDQIQRGPRFFYMINNIKKQYRSDFLYKNFVFEIKSSWTYGAKDEERRNSNHLKFKSVDSTYKLIIVFDKKWFIKVTDDNINENLYYCNLTPISELIEFIN